LRKGAGLSDQPGDSDLRRRAAWLLAMLAVVAALFVLLFTTVLNGSGASHHDNNAAPDDTLAPTVTRSVHSSSGPNRSTSAGPSASGVPSNGPTNGTTGEPSGPSTSTCPSMQPSVLQGDSADVIAAINDYRTQNGRQAVPGKVSKSAQKCALSNGGGGCSGGWAESQLDQLDGKAAVDKISKLGNLLDPQLKSVGVGWAYAPAQKQYYIAIVRND
jgi:hypothetical protein